MWSIRAKQMAATKTLFVCVFVSLAFLGAQVWTTYHLGRAAAEATRNWDVTEETSEPVLTLFTSTKTSDVSRLQIHRTTLVNWASLRPWVRPVLCVLPEDAGFVGEALAAGWEVLPVEHTLENIPVIRSLFTQITRAPGPLRATPFYGYANADILFDDGLVNTLKSLSRVNFTTAGVLMTGRRINVKTIYIRGVSAGHRTNVEPLRRQGKPSDPNAQDYFITTPGGFPWDEVPDFVLGRPGYDNWLVAQALAWKLTVVDLSKSVTAIHQTGADGDRAGWSAHDLCINRNLAGPFDYMAGQTVCATWYTTRDFEGRLSLIQRPWLPSRCKPRVMTSLSKDIARKQAGDLTATRSPRPREQSRGSSDNPCVF